MSQYIKQNLSLLLIIFFTTTAALAQKNFTEDAERAFKGESYYSAIDLYKKAYSKEKNRDVKTDIIFKIAECYRLIENPREAEAWYDKAIKAQYPDPIVYFQMAEVLRIQGKYDEAISEYNRYAAKVPDDQLVKKRLQASDQAQKWKSNPENYNIENMGLINSKAHDFSPVIASSKGDAIVFTSMRQSAFGNEIDSRSGQSFSDLYISELDRRGKWSNPVVLPEPVNSPFNEGAATFDAKYQNIYFTRCGLEKKKVIGCQIFVAKKQGKGWAVPDTVPLGIDDSTTVGHPAMSPNEEFMIFASDMIGGYGGKDLYYVEYDKKKRTWGEPVNLGSDINTKDDEMFPFVHANGNLYFASNGHPGMGGFDMFIAEKTGTRTWKNVKNLKAPLNSAANDFGIVFEGEKDQGYFSSDRPGGKGGDDIYAFKRPPVIYALNGVVSDVDTKEKIADALVKLIGTDGSSYEVKTDKNGFYEFNEIDESDDRYIIENTSYTILVSKENYLNSKGQETTVGVNQSTQFVHDFVLQSIKTKEIPLPLVLYDLGSAKLRPESKDSLNFLYQTLVDNPTIIIELSAHTDSRGSAELNEDLSQRRAESCVKYLIEKGIPAERMQAKGYGKRRLLVTDEEIAKLETEAEREIAHQKNRRTVFAVLSTDYVPNATNQDN